MPILNKQNFDKLIRESEQLVIQKKDKYFGQLIYGCNGHESNSPLFSDISFINNEYNNNYSFKIDDFSKTISVNQASLQLSNDLHLALLDYPYVMSRVVSSIWESNRYLLFFHIIEGWTYVFKERYVYIATIENYRIYDNYVISKNYSYNNDTYLKKLMDDFIIFSTNKEDTKIHSRIYDL